MRLRFLQKCYNLLRPKFETKPHTLASAGVTVVFLRFYEKEPLSVDQGMWHKWGSVLLLGEEGANCVFIAILFPARKPKRAWPLITEEESASVTKARVTIRFDPSN